MNLGRTSLGDLVPMSTGVPQNPVINNMIRQQALSGLGCGPELPGQQQSVGWWNAGQPGASTQGRDVTWADITLAGLADFVPSRNELNMVALKSPEATCSSVKP